MGFQFEIVPCKYTFTLVPVRQGQHVQQDFKALLQDTSFGRQEPATVMKGTPDGDVLPGVMDSWDKNAMTTICAGKQLRTLNKIALLLIIQTLNNIPLGNVQIYLRILMESSLVQQ